MSLRGVVAVNTIGVFEMSHRLVQLLLEEKLFHSLDTANINVGTFVPTAREGIKAAAL